MSNYIAYIISLLGISWGIYQYSDKKRIERKNTNRNAYTKIVEVISIFLSSITKAIFISPFDDILKAKEQQKIMNHQLEMIEGQLVNLKKEAEKGVQLVLQKEEFSALKFQEIKIQFSQVKDTLKNHKENIENADNILNDLIDDELENAFNSFILNLETNADWKLFSSEKAVQLVREIIQDAKEMKLKINKVNLSSNKSETYIKLSIIEEALRFRPKLEDLVEQLRMEIK